MIENEMGALSYYKNIALPVYGFTLQRYGVTPSYIYNGNTIHRKTTYIWNQGPGCLAYLYFSSFRVFRIPHSVWTQLRLQFGVILHSGCPIYLYHYIQMTNDSRPAFRRIDQIFTTLNELCTRVTPCCSVVSIESTHIISLHIEAETKWPLYRRRHLQILNENIWISIKISLCVPKVTIHFIPALVQTMAWSRLCDKSLFETTMASLLTHICVTRPQRVKDCFADTEIIIRLDQCKRGNIGNESHRDIVDYHMSITQQNTTRPRKIFVISRRTLWIHSLSGLFALM